MNPGILKSSLIHKKSFFVHSANRYAELSQVNALHSFVNYESHVVDKEIEHSDIVNLYEKLKKNKGASDYYNKMRNSSKNCLYCSENLVKCLDHYLPKSDFPLLSITPSNLVPCCNDCNFKLNELSNYNSPLIIHPYFEHYDDIFDKQWVYARVPIDQPFFTQKDFQGIAVVFYTNFKDTALEASVRNRIEFQFKNLMVDSYISKGSAVLSKELNRLRRYLGTPNQLKTVHKEYLLDIMLDYPINSFYHAIYHALANSEIYLETIQEEFF